MYVHTVTVPGFAQHIFNKTPDSNFWCPVTFTIIFLHSTVIGKSFRYINCIFFISRSVLSYFIYFIYVYVYTDDCDFFHTYKTFSYCSRERKLYFSIVETWKSLHFLNTSIWKEVNILNSNPTTLSVSQARNSSQKLIYVHPCHLLP